MPGSSPAEAVDRFLGALQLATSCLRPTPFLVSHDARTTLGEIHGVATRMPIPVRRRRTDDGEKRPDLLLSVALEYEIVERSGPRSERYKVSTRRYQHHVLDADGREILLFHWHPTTGSAAPHLHVSGPRPDNPYTHKAHIPTGRVTLEAIVRFLLTELHAVAGRNDWIATLDRCDANFTKYATW